MTLAIGDPAPDSTLIDTTGAPVTLSQSWVKSPVLLVFYPGDETPVCRAQLCEFRDNWERAKSHNTLVFGVNPADSASHEKFREKNKLPFPLIVDAGRKVCDLYHTNGLIVKRTVYVIGPDGTILYAKRGKPSVSEVLAAAK